jgi:hypothetical protein
MALSVIGAGFGRTGTESMKMALEILGLGPCHHMKEVIADPEKIRLWRSIARGIHAPATVSTVDEPRWEQAFAGYSAAVDWPSAYFWRELSEYYPRAKILLTVRSPESWHASMEKTIFKTLKESTDRASIGIRLIAEGVFGGRIHDRNHAISIYEKNIEEVQAAFDGDRLLTYRLGDGWEPLCRFLGKPVPDVPYPRSNSTDDFNAMLARMKEAGPS